MRKSLVILSTLMLLTFTSCNKCRMCQPGVEPDEPQGQPMGLVALGTDGFSVDGSGVSVQVRRAAGDGDVIASRQGALPATIGAFILQNGVQTHTCWTKADEHDRDSLPTDYIYSGDKLSRPVWIAAPTEVFAYAPYQNSGVTMSYVGDTLQTLTWKSIPSLSTADFLVGYKKAHCDHTWALTEPVDHVPFRFCHILSRTRVMFQLSEAFQPYRTVEIVQVAMLVPKTKYTLTKYTPQAYAWDERYTDLSKSKPEWDVEFIDGYDTVPLPMEEYDYLTLEKAFPEDSVEKKSIEKDTEYKDTRLLLCRERDDKYYYHENGAYPLEFYQPWGSFYLPPMQRKGSVTIIVTYNVYDNARLVSRRRSTDNATFTIGASDGSKWTPEAGACYNLMVTIDPRFLYVLTDED